MGRGLWRKISTITLRSWPRSRRWRRLVSTSELTGQILSCAETLHSTDSSGRWPRSTRASDVCTNSCAKHKNSSSSSLGTNCSWRRILILRNTLSRSTESSVCLRERRWNIPFSRHILLLHEHYYNSILVNIYPSVHGLKYMKCVFGTKRGIN